MDFFEASMLDMGIDLRGGDAGMAQHHLNRSQIHTTVESSHLLSARQQIIGQFINCDAKNMNVFGNDLIPAKLLLAFTRCSASTRKREDVNPGCLPFGWIPAYNRGYDSK